MSEELDRRRFLANAGLAVGAVVASGVAPLGFAKPLAPAPAAPAHVAHGTGHVDDACGHWPPYAHPIPYGYHAPAAGSAWEKWDPIDHIFMI